MNAPTTMTEKEAAIIEFVANEGLDCMGGSTPADLHDDNMAFCYPRDIVRVLEMSKETVAGLLSSLEEKGLVDLDMNESRKEVWLTESGIDAAEELANR